MKFLDLFFVRKLHVGVNKAGEGSTIVLLHGLGCTHEVWADLIKKLPPNTSIIAPDLLGFGDSKKPRLASYSNYLQAKSVIKTLKSYGRTKNLIIIGHSMGGLIATEVARLRPDFCDEIILCGAPIYRSKLDGQRTKKEEEILKQIYKITAHKINKNQDETVELIALVKKLGMTPRAIEINDATIEPYVKSLKSGVLKQKTIKQLAQSNLKITLVNGLFDPLVIRQNTAELIKAPNINKKTLVASHELSNRFVKYLSKYLRKKLQ